MCVKYVLKSKRNQNKKAVRGTMFDFDISSSTAQHFAADLAAHFTTKVEKVRTATTEASPPVINFRQSATLADLAPVSVEEAAKLLKSAPNQTCQLDPIPTWILKKSADRFAPLFAALCNSSYSSGLPPSQKHALVSARLKKTTMDPDDLNSYRPISNLSFASKLVERSVAACFVKHCDQIHLFPIRQSAFRRHHSTETAVLIVHNDIIRAIDNGQLTVMLFLDLSSAFDTVDHDIICCLFYIVASQLTARR